MKFEFINDFKFKDILLRDYEELMKCYEVKATKSVLILCGSIIETILTEYFIESLPNGNTKEDILKMSLGKLLDLAENNNLITSKIKKLSSVIQDYRNLIHPGREVRINEGFNNDDAEISMSLLRIIVDSIKTKYSEKIKYTAFDVFEKLKNDWGFQSVYAIVITKLNYQERENLLELFIEFEKYEKTKLGYFSLSADDEQKDDKYGLVEIEEVKQFVKELKPLLKQELIEKKLADLLNSITKGEQIVTLSLYNLFHEELILLKKDDQELVAIYMLSLLEVILDESSIFSKEKTFSTIGKYIHTDKGLKKLQAFTEYAIINYYWKTIEKEMNVFEQIYNSLNSDLRDKLRIHIDAFLSPKKHIPNDILEGFVKEAVRRGILDDKYGN
jgi:hypothetical protein